MQKKELLCLLFHNISEISKIVQVVIIIDRLGVKRTVNVTSKDFKYRGNNFLNDGDIIVGAKICNFGFSPKISEKIKNYLISRSKSQPSSSNNCGSIFKNYINDITCRAGHFIDIMGLKGFTYKGIKISNMHANFFENIGEASSVEFFEMIDFVKKELNLSYGIDFELEVKQEEYI